MMNIDFDNNTSIDVNILNSGEVDFTMEGQVPGTTNYNLLTNKPQINEVTLIGNKSSEDLHLQDEMDYLTNMEIEELLNNFG